MLIGKYVISPIDGKKYCRKNGQFLEHLRANGFITYTAFFEHTFPDKVEYCSCGAKRTFAEHKMKYKLTCGSKECANKVSSQKKQARTCKELDKWRMKYRQTMSLKTEHEKQNLIERRRKTGIKKRSYKNSVLIREQTCIARYNDKKYNNSKKISATKLAWGEARKQLFLERLKFALGGKTLNDFHTEEMYIVRRKMLEARGDIVPEHLLTLWEKYNKKVRGITRRNYKRFKNIINPADLSTGRAGQNGAYQLDHIVPVQYGFLNYIPEELIASVDNLQMLYWKANATKGKNYDPTISTKHKELENTNK